jgi:hypothetical protein
MGFFVDAGVVCAAANAATNSTAEITRVFFILSSLFFRVLVREQDSAVGAPAPHEFRAIVESVAGLLGSRMIFLHFRPLPGATSPVQL